VIGRAEIERAIVGSWRLFTGKGDALTYFDTSRDGFWRSFQVVALVAPAYFITALADRPLATATDGRYWTARVVTLGFDWVTYPILTGLLARFLRIEQGYVPFIAVRNWATLLAILPFAAISLVQILGFDNADILFFPAVLALAFSLRLGYLTARRTLGVGIDVALALVLLDVLTSLAVVRIIGALFGVAMDA
jgi:hypothetical protein